MTRQLFGRSTAVAIVCLMGVSLLLTSAWAVPNFGTRLTMDRRVLRDVTENVTLEPLSMMGGGLLYDAVVQTGYAYLGIGQWLIVLDVSDPAHPTMVGQRAVLSGGIVGFVKNVDVFGDYAYVTTTNGDLHIIDVSDPSHPVEVGRYGSYALPIQNLHVSGNYAYLGWGRCSTAGDREPIQICNGGLRIVDLSDLNYPIKVGELSYGKPTKVIYATDNYVYLANGHVVDVSDPSTPVDVATFPATQEAFVAGNYLLAEAGGSGLRVIDISDPTAPREVTTYGAVTNIRSIYVLGEYAYVVDRQATLHVIDVSNPAAPVLVSSFRVSDGTTYGVKIAGAAEGHVYVTSWEALHVIDLSNLATPVEVSTYRTEAWHVNSVYVVGRYAYVTTRDAISTGETRLRVIDISDPSSPEEVGSYPSVYGPVFVSGDYAYVASGALQILDVSNPTAPVEVGKLEVPAHDVYVADQYAYVVGGGALRVIDISNPNAPVEVGSFTSPGNIGDFYVSGHYAYVLDALYAYIGPHRGVGALRIIDIADPHEPMEVGVIDIPAFPEAVYVSGTYAYVVNRNLENRGQFWIIDVSDPTSPREVRHYQMGNPSNVFVAGFYAFVTDTHTGLQVFDVSDPSALVQVASPPRVACCPAQVFVAGDLVLVAAGDGGLLIFRAAAHRQEQQTQSSLLTRVANRTLNMRFEAWDWDSGVAMYGLMKAWEATGDQRYFDFVKAWVDGFIVRGLPPITHPNHTTPGLATLMLYEATGEEKYIAAAREMASYLLHHAPRSAEGTMYHYEDQLWVDTLFVTAPFLTRFSRDTGDPRYAEEAVKQFLLHAQYLQDPETGLFYHGWDESDDSHMSAAFWERGNGWALAAGAELLDLLPADHPARPQIRDILARQVEGLLPLQDPSGLWHTVVDRPDFYLETSGAAAIGYGLFRGLDQGWLDPARVNRAAQLVRHGVEAKVAWDGTVLGVSSGTGVAPTVEDYNRIPHGSIQPWGQGLAMLLLSQRPYGFRLNVTPSVALVAPGQSTYVTVATTQAYGPLPDQFDLLLSGAPDFLSWTFTPTGALSARLTLTTTASAPVGSYPLAVSAQSGTLTRTADFTLRVVTQTYTVLLPFVARQHNPSQLPIIQLTDDPAKDWQPTLASDGRLAFISDRSGAPHLYIQAPGDVPVRVQVLNSEEEDRPLFAADGRLAFSTRNPYSQWDVAIYTGAPWLWFPLGQPRSNELHPAISPDGRFMAYVSDHSGNWEIYVVELRRMDPQLTFHVAADRVPSWSPDGKEIVFRSEWQGNSDIYVMDVETRELRRLTEDPAADAWPSFSPDGRWILFQSDRAGNNNVYVMDRNGGQVTPITTDPAEDLTPSWSPDGRYILFASNRDGDFDIYRVPFRPPKPKRLYPNYEIANKVWQAVERFVEEHPPAEIYPGYAPDAGGPSAENVRTNVDAACHDFPDLPDLFGEGAHHHACYEWVAAYLGLYHATKAWRTGSTKDLTWAQRYLDATLDYLTEFVYGPEDSPTGVGYRDTLAAIWQNPMRAINVTLLADLLHRQGALTAEQQARVEELLSGIVRAWYAEFWQTGQHPNTGVPFTIRTAPEVQAFSLAGHQVVSTFPWTFHWDADKGNTMAEEVSWMGAGVMLATRVLKDRLPDAAEIYAAARHYVDFAVSFDRPDPIHGGTVRSLNAETTGGAYGQRRYWFENHAPDMPSLPYMGYTWDSIDMALLAADLGDQQPWPSLVPDDAQWDVLLRSAGETMRAADDTFLIDFTPGQGIGYNLETFPEWWVPCGQGRPGRQYVRYDGRAGGPPLFLSEIGHSAGMDLLLTGWPIMRIAAHRGDTGSYQVWEERLHRVLDEYIARPVNPGWAQCKTAPYVSANPGYHWARMLTVFLHLYLGASGYEVEPWD